MVSLTFDASSRGHTALKLHPSASGGENSGNGGATSADGGAHVAEGGASSADGGAHVAEGGAGFTNGGADASEGGAIGVAATGVSAGEAASKSGPRWLGRVDITDPAAPRFAWSGTGLAALVKGSRISVRLKTEGTDTVFFQPVIDGIPGSRFEVRSDAVEPIVLGENLSETEHSVALYRENEGYFGDSVFEGFVDGIVTGAPPAAPHLIEVIGDSITAGYGNLGSEVHFPWNTTCGFSLAQQSAYLSYGAQLARLLNAEASIIAVGGWGLYRDFGGNRQSALPIVYGNLMGTQPAPAYDFERKPDAVVINLGTNDVARSDPGKAFEDAYVDFLTTIRSHYPNAWLFLTIGPMTAEPKLTIMRAHIDAVVARFADERTTQVLMDPQDKTYTGCGYHPNVAEDAQMAATLEAAMQEKLHW